MSKPTGKLIRVTPEGIGAVSTGNIIQATGDSPTKIMSQKAVTDALKTSVNIDSIYPIGIVVWFAQNKNPNTLFPGTKWQYIGENKTIRLANSSGNNVLNIGGSDHVTIGKVHLPAVTLKYSGTTESSGAHTHTRGTMNITGEHGYQRTSDSGIMYAYASGAYSLVAGPNNAGYSGSAIRNSHKYVFDASKTWTGSTSSDGVHTHSYSGSTESLGSGTALAVTNAYIMLMGWYRIS
ncbi:phage tail protein [Providencia manganoxydans]|uniref:phage baseplate protein n=1 Tax=Providencia manganoxydans TaxID=2923283 RepID=UPI0032DA963E